MSPVEIPDGGWSRDLPDHRDYTQHHPAVGRMLAKLRPLKSVPRQVDWREYCAAAQDQLGLPTSTAHACLGLIQYFERRASGRLIHGSRMFLHANAQRLAVANGSAGLRTTIKAVTRFGLPPESLYPYGLGTLQQTPDPYLYGFNSDYRRLRYLRLDASPLAGEQILEIVKSFLAGGFACAFGFGVPSSLTSGPEIPYPTWMDSIRAGQAAIAVGYDDSLRIRSERGALLVRSSWGATWGTDGFGWLPFRYITDRLAADIWTLLSANWVRSEEFYRPF